MRSLSLHCPSVITKELKLQTPASGERWLRLSSNLLPLVGFESGCRFERRILSPAGGFEFSLSPVGRTKVYQRVYQHRRNAPTETVIDFKAQEFLNAAIPFGVDRVHLTLTNGRIVGRPVPERTFHIRRAIRQQTTPFEAFVALSGGVDAAHLSAAGFKMQALLEFRPRERRDSTDLSETGVLTAIANNSFRYVFNEDIYKIDFDRVRRQLAGQPPVAVLAISPQCDEFSQAKNPSAKLAHIESLETTVDMVYEVLRLVETIQPAVVHVENVSGFGNSAAGELLVLKLRRWGFHVSSGVYDARDFGGATSRKRFYLVASVFPGFQPPISVPNDAIAGAIWRLIEDQLEFCRDASTSSSLLDGIATGRARIITPHSAYAPTILKSQNRHTKDSIYIQTLDGRHLFPNETVLRRLQGIPADFNLDVVGQEVAAEVIGQSVDGPMHAAFARAIKAHLDDNRAGRVVNSTCVAVAPQVSVIGEREMQHQFAF